MIGFRGVGKKAWRGFALPFLSTNASVRCLISKSRSRPHCEAHGTEKNGSFSDDLVGFLGVIAFENQLLES